MKKFLPWFLVVLFASEFLLALRPRKEKDFHFREFGSLPVLLNGRIQPFDSVARNSLLQIRSQQEVPLEGNAGKGWGTWESLAGQGTLTERHWWQFHKHPKKLKPTPWLLELMTRPDDADKRYVFLVHHPELLSLLKLEGKGVENSALHFFSFNDLAPSREIIQKEYESIAEIKDQLRTPFQRQLAKLYNAMVIYQRLQTSLQPRAAQSFSAEISSFEKNLEAGIAAFKAREAGEKYDQEVFKQLLVSLNEFQNMHRMAMPLIVPPLDPEKNRDDWKNMGTALLDSGKNRTLHPALPLLARISESYQKGDVEGFNTAVAAYRDWLGPDFKTEIQKGQKEYRFSHAQPFYRAMLAYLVIFILGIFSWFNWSETLRRSAFYLSFVALGIHTFGLVMRMVLEGRPPVTNLYSSALFIGWAAVILGMILERIFKDGIGIVIGSAVGFITQIIAHNLALGGDTMEMMQAVLDTNFWLATHVVVITIGYAATYAAGVLGIVYILRGFFTRSLGEKTAKNLLRMIYGIVCFATLFSFVGTILGGIWADQSWGRFWGWDPKENGALIIVIWNATILHARWGGMVRDRGLAAMAVFGNCVTTWSYFGVNMLGVGLHSYGFMDEAFRWMVYFGISQALIIAVACFPTKYWASFRVAPKSAPPNPPGPMPKGNAVSA